MSGLAISSIALICFILWMVLVPPKALRERYAKAQPKRRATDIFKAPDVTFPAISIVGVTIRRVNLTINLTGFVCPEQIFFKGVVEGNSSDTVYLLVDRTNVIKQYANEAALVSAFKEGDYGMVALTMAPGRIMQRTIASTNASTDHVPHIELSFVAR